MIVLLILSIMIVLLNILIIGILTSKVSINIEEYSAYSNCGLSDIIVDKMHVSINLYLYKFIKILSIKFYKEYLKIGFIKIYYCKIAQYKKIFLKKSFSLGKFLVSKKNLHLKDLKPNIEIFNLNLSLCSKDAAVTSICSSLIGTSIAFVLSKFVKKYDNKKVFFKIVPVYFNINGFKINLKTKVNFNVLNILVFLVI